MEEKELNKENVNEDVEKNAETNPSESEATDETTAQEKTNFEEQISELNDKYLRLYSEFDNYRKRTNKEKLDIITNANASLLVDILPTLDDFERAIDNNEKVDDIEAVKQGFTLIYNKLMSTLESKGLKQMKAKGETFDSELHDAIAKMPAPTDDMNGKIIDDPTKGYYLNDKVIRHAKVVVGQK